MGKISSDEIHDILKRYESKLGASINLDTMEFFPGESFSREYVIFRREALEREVGRYERLCHLAERFFHITAKEKDRVRIEKAIETAHLDITSQGAVSLAVFATIFIILFGVGLGILLYFFSGNTLGFFEEGALKPLDFGVFSWPLLFLIFGALLIKPLSLYPLRVASRWRLKASNQMVLCILYIVMYMRHTSNLENAIKFAGEHIGEPLALDLRKVLWDVETGKFVTIKESLDYYLERWRDHSLEFIESLHLVESSLYESSEERRIHLLEKSLEVILNGTYEKMLHYAQDLKSPITMVYMMGVILPVLGLVIFPLMSGFLSGLVKWWHLAFLYNIILPLFVYFFGMNYLEKRPTGYGSEDILNLYPSFEEYTQLTVFKKSVSPLPLALVIGFVFVVIGMSPLIYFYSLGTYEPAHDPVFFGYTFLDFKENNGVLVGPYGMWSMLLSLFVPLGLAYGIAFYYYIWSRRLIIIKRNTKALEREFSGAVFQLGNRVGDGIPVESAFSKVAESMKGTPTGDFLRIVNVNIRKLGMSVKDAIFNPQRGGLTYFPSNLIKSSMKVLVESAKKGPQVVSKSLITISGYVNNVHTISERLKDLLADIISSMKSQTSFLTPMIAGIVVGVTSMMINIINFLGTALADFGSGESVGLASGSAGLSSLTGILDVVNIKDIIPGYQFQIVVGLFVVEMAIILSILSSGIDNGIDRVEQRYTIAKSLFVSTSLYFVITFVAILIFSILACGVADVGAAAGGVGSVC